MAGLKSLLLGIGKKRGRDDKDKKTKPLEIYFKTETKHSYSPPV
jgi:hypothetical protein